MRWTVAALCLALSAGRLAAEEVTPLPAVFKAKKAYDGRTICIQGKTTSLFQKYSRHGHHYFTVWVSDGGEKIKVFGCGFPTFSEGDAIEACGRYQETKTRSGRIFYDEFTANAILKGAAMHAGKVTLTPAGLQAGPGAPPAASGFAKPGSDWSVYKGDKEVLRLKNAPGPIISTALLAPGAEPVRHPFVTAAALDAAEEYDFQVILKRSRNFDDFVANLRKAGYEVLPSSSGL
ncbi:MAG: hypothetical protein NTX64_11085 [Elusimicrobia bacterium]|nr:hypothetical protein [Elusimicrobiota bacterium]